MLDNDPLWRLRHALAGLGLALACSVVIAALIGSVLGDVLGGTYGWRVGTYALLLLYVVVGAGVLFVKVAQHETRPLSLGRLARWVDLESGERRLLWLRPALRARWVEQLEARAQALDALFHRHRLRPLRLVDGFDADAVTAHFHR